MILLAGILRAEIVGSEPRTSTLPVADASRSRAPGSRQGCGACPMVRHLTSTGRLRAISSTFLCPEPGATYASGKYRKGA